MKKQGIYQIKNTKNNKVYIGSSKHIKKRFDQHKRKLNLNKHWNIILQRAWNKYGAESFSFDIIEETILLKRKELLSLEQLYLDNNPNKYNIAPTSGGDLLTNHPNRKQIIEKITKSVQDRFDNMSDEDRKKISERQMGSKNGNWKGGRTFCKCGNRIDGKSKTCGWCRDRTGENNPFYGKTHTEDVKNMISESLSGRKRDINNLPFFIGSKKYRTLQEASEDINTHITTIRHRLNSKNPKFKDYVYEGEEKEIYTEEEYKERFSKPQKGSKKHHNKSFTIDDIEYRTLKDASDKLDIHKSTIKGRLLSDNFPKYKYI